MIDLASVPTKTWSEIATQARGLFCDVDDTLTDQGLLSADAYAALVRTRAAGLRIVLVTGRPLGWAEVLAAIFPIDAAIAENGAVAALPGGERIYFEDEASRADGERRRAAALHNVRAALPMLRLARDQDHRAIDLAFDIAETVRVDEADIATLDAILRAGGLFTTRSSIHFHGTFSTATKATMSARIAEYLWQESVADLKDRYFYVGDSPNDAPAFSFFTHSIGVANVRDHEATLQEAHALPWAVTSTRGGRGFAEAALRICNARIT